MINNLSNRNCPPTPSLLEALLIAEAIGIKDFPDAIDHYFNKAHMFFHFEKIDEQLITFKKELMEKEFIDKENCLIETTVSAALKKINYGLPLPKN